MFLNFFIAFLVCTILPPAFFIDVPYIFFNTFLVAMLGEAEDPKQHMGQFCLKT